MEKYENEQFKVDEITKIEEYQHFKAEDFKSLELFSLKNEEYKVEEFEKYAKIRYIESGDADKKLSEEDYKDYKIKATDEAKSALLI